MKLLAATIAGGGLGLGWYSTVGCWSGTCGIASDPLLCTGYFAFLGWLLFGGANWIHVGLGKVLHRT